MTPRALVTGGAGFAAQWLERALLERGWEVSGAGLGVPPQTAVLDEAGRRAIRWIEADVRRAADIGRALDATRPDALFHLAGIAFVPAAAADPAEAYEVNVVGAVRLLAAVGQRRDAGILDPVVLVVGSGEQYGRHDPSELPLPESAAQRPLSVYAASKAAQEVVALHAARAQGLRIIATRSFNHSGPGQASHFLLPALVARALEARADGRWAVAVGNREPIRDYLHVEDVAAAYIALAARGVPGEVYNVCSGEGVAVGQLAADVLQRVGVGADITTDPSLVRPVDLPALVGSPEKLRRATGWSPRRTRADIIDDLIHAQTH
ncbi:MAG: GDP-mannose 4,6-dehydratase [Gemmatimonadota bacterium]|nr:GDP-mannose 4,6-dehydratase [Gemmatimonadota bacterium]